MVCLQMTVNLIILSLEDTLVYTTDESKYDAATTKTTGSRK